MLGRLDKQTLVAARHLKWSTNVKVVWHTFIPSDTTIVITDVPERYNNLKPHKLVTINYEYNPQKIAQASDDTIVMPFTMHPQIYFQFFLHNKLEDYRYQKRNVTLLFAGNTSPDYDNEAIEQVCGILGRHRIVNHIRQKNITFTVTDEAQYTQLFEAPFHNKLAIIENYRTPQNDWMRLISNSVFFLALPGIRYPLSHNLVEAMAVGTIPITNYPDWLHPKLVDGETCLAFQTLEELDTKIEQALNMSAQEIELMRTNVIQYYKEFLDSQSLMDNIVEHHSASITMYVIDGSSTS